MLIFSRCEYKQCCEIIITQVFIITLVILIYEPHRTHLHVKDDILHICNVILY